MENTNINLENYLCFKKTGSHIHTYIHYVTNGNITPNIEYSNDEGISWQPWQKLTQNEYYIPISTEQNQVYVRGNNVSRISDSENHFVLEYITISGNLMSLVDGSGLTNNIPADYMFSNLFRCSGGGIIIRNLLFPATKLTNGCYSEMFYGNVRCLGTLSLPATTLADSCYEGMFRCVDFVTGGKIPSPELPSTTLANRCYAYMFSDASINNAPELPATILADSCYEGMFSNCGLDNAPELPATTLADSCYKGMFSGASIKKAPAELPATILADSCYEDMFRGTSINNTPELPATTLADSCYKGMFSGSTISTPPELPATILTNSCYESMFDYCRELSNATELPATTLADSCYKYMFRGSTIFTAPAELPATTLADSCYEGMFGGTSINNTPELPATTLADSCYAYMFSNTSIKKAPKLPATILANSCYEGMFSGSTISTPPELPATTLADSCYAYMFSNSSISTAPKLPSKNLTFYCYEGMFKNCYEINEITCLAENIFVEGCREGWVDGINLSNGTFIKMKGVLWPIHNTNGIPKKWNIEEIEIDTPSIPPSSTGNKFSGFHMVKQTTYNKLLKDGLIQKALYFVRDFDNENNPNKTSIYFGERLYASNYGIDGDDV